MVLPEKTGKPLTGLDLERIDIDELNGGDLANSNNGDIIRSNGDGTLGVAPEGTNLPMYSTGDIMPVISQGTGQYLRRTTSTAAPNWEVEDLLWGQYIKFADYFPDPTAIKVCLNVRMSPGVGEIMNFEIFNNTDKETVVSLTTPDDTGSSYSTGWVNYSPTSPNQVAQLYARVNTDPGTNTGDSLAPMVSFGVEV